MLRLQSKITFTSKTDSSVNTFDFVTEVETSESFEDLTQTAKITIPRKIKYDGKPIAVGFNSIFKRGDKVKIELGYFKDIKTIFNGYITNISNKTPLVFECEDEMFVLKTKVIKKYSVKKTSLKDLIKEIVGDTVKYKLLVEVPIMGSFTITNASVAKVLDEIKSGYGLYSYFVDGVLNIGLAANVTVTNTEEFKFEETIINENDLEYKREEDVKLKIKGVSMDDKNKKTEIEVGDEDGEQKTFHIYKASESALKEFAEGKLKTFKYEGYRGMLETFGEPYIRHGDNAKLTSKKFAEKNGTYQVVSVNRTFGQSGYRQKIQLGIKVA
jgi:hypothetical protein